MASEAKIGLVLGVALVIIVAVIFFRKELLSSNTTTEAIAPTKTQTTLISRE